MTLYLALATIHDYHSDSAPKKQKKTTKNKQSRDIRAKIRAKIRKYGENQAK